MTEHDDWQLEDVYDMDLYSVLNVSSKATSSEIKASYQKMVLQHHPDKQGGEESELFHMIIKAYRTLSDPLARRKYDAHRRLMEDYKDLNVWDEVVVSDFRTEIQCRCGGSYVGPDKEPTDNEKIFVDCDTCSLSIVMMYQKEK